MLGYSCPYDDFAFNFTSSPVAKKIISDLIAANVKVNWLMSANVAAVDPAAIRRGRALPEHHLLTGRIAMSGTLEKTLQASRGASITSCPRAPKRVWRCRCSASMDRPLSPLSRAGWIRCTPTPRALCSLLRRSRRVCWRLVSRTRHVSRTEADKQ